MYDFERKLERTTLDTRMSRCLSPIRHVADQEHFHVSFLNFETISTPFQVLQSLSLSRLNTTTLPPRIVHAQRPHTQSTTTRPSVHITAHTNTPPPCRACSGSNRLTAALPFDQSLQTAHTKIHHVCSGRGEPPQGRSDGGDDLQVVRSGVFSGSCIMPGSTVVPRHVNSIVWLGWSRARLLSGCPVYKGLGFVATLMLTR
jgi:hypothetical protein